MSNTTVEEVIEEVKTLSPEEREKFREFVETIALLFTLGHAMEIMKKTLTLMPADMRQLRDALNRATFEMVGPDIRADMARSIRGKYAHLPTSSEGFAARKAEEINLEERSRSSS